MKIAVWGNELTAFVTSGALAAHGYVLYFVSHSNIPVPIPLIGRRIRNEPPLRALLFVHIGKPRLYFAHTPAATGSTSAP